MLPPLLLIVNILFENILMLYVDNHFMARYYLHMTNSQIRKMSTSNLQDTICDYESFGMDPVIVEKMRLELERRQEDELAEYDVDELSCGWMQ